MSGSSVIPVRVAVRCRPLVESELHDGCQSLLQFPAGEMQVIAGADKIFSYDFVFSPTSVQASIYENAVSPLLDNLFKGYNATVLAYGQTGSGKTFTMGGGIEMCSSSDENVAGIIPRVINVLFNRVQDDEEFDYNIRVTYLELYHDDLNDLLVPASERVKDAVQIREEAAGGIKIVGALEKEVKTAAEMRQCLLQGSQGRSTGATAMNQQSSRSHAIFTITLERTSRSDSNDFCRSKFHLVDLAGSERAKKTQATGERFKEGVSINKGLLALGNVISALGEETGKKDRYIPYRDSKLTRLLQDSLGGNSYTLMIACVSPADSNLEETLSTLRYADRARKIKNKPVVNRDPQAAEILRLRQLVQELQVQLVGGGKCVNTSPSAPSTVSTSAIEELSSKLKKLQEENKKLLTELQQTVDQNAALCEKLVITEANLEKMRDTVEDVKRKTQETLAESYMEDKENQNAAESKNVTFLKDIHSKLDSVLVIADDVDEMSSSPGAADSSFTYDTSCDRICAMKEHVERQTRLGHELQQLTDLMNQKQQLAQQLQSQQDSSEINLLREQYKSSMKHLSEEIEKLQKEKDELNEALQQAKLSTAASKLSEQRRKRLQELETQLSALRKQMLEQSRIVKLKEQTDKQAEKLAADIQFMKQQRVKLVKQMKLDSDSFTKYKQEADKQVIQLKAQDRKRQVEMAKLVQKNSLQEAVLKRKAEEAAAAHKRLKEVLMKQKTAAKQRQGQQDREEGAGLGARVKKWLADELEIMVSVNEARHHLEQLMADRKELSEQLRQTKAKLEGRLPVKKKMTDGRKGESTDCETTNLQSELKLLQQQIDIRNAQISEMQQKVMDADQESVHWTGMHSMAEAKCAVKQLLTMAVSNQLSSSQQTTKLKEEETAKQTQEQIVKEVKRELEDQRHRYETELVTLRKECEERVSCLLDQLKPMTTVADRTAVNSRTVTKDKSRSSVHQQNEEIKEELSALKEQKKTLEKELTVLKYKFRRLGRADALHENLMPADESFFSPAHGVEPLSEINGFSDSEASDSDNSGKEDPEWSEGNTPGYRLTRANARRNTRKRKTMSIKQLSVSTLNTTHYY